MRFLLCRIGSRIGALALPDVRETMRPLPVESLAAAPPFILGLAVVRGFPVPVIDANRLLGVSAVSPVSGSAAHCARFVSLELGERTVALAVDAVLAVRSLPAGMLEDMSPLLREADAQVVSAIGALDANLLVVLEAARLVPEPVWSAIDAAGVAA